MNALRGFSQWLAKHSDVMVAGLVVMILAIMIIRVPPVVIDVLIGTNIAIAVTVLMVALYIPNAMKLPAFPTVLLLTTLFRLGLNVSTTRLILLDANAGDIIDAFGDFVVGGNFVVGGVVFIVLVLVQFIVIAKGSERVAEVGARFTLDAMPGKQMSIDADLRGGLITPDQARHRRVELEKESKLYGAMDGAMKFVKGDAIAGIIISMINIVGGLVIGVMQLGMSAGEAAEVYSLLTIGDGLVSQIPALLISVSAGLVVTRVAAGSDTEKTHVAQDMFKQVLNQPKAIAIVTVVLIGLGLLPGFPTAVFWVLALIAAAAAFSAAPQVAAEAAAADLARDGGTVESPGDAKEADAVGRFPRTPVPVVLELHSSLASSFIERKDVVGADGVSKPTVSSRADVLEKLTALRKGLEEEMGFPFPPVVLRPDDRMFTMPGYAILFFDAPVAHAPMVPNQVFLSGGITKTDAEELGLKSVAPLPWTRAAMPIVTPNMVEETAKLIKTKNDSKPVFALQARDVIIEHVRVMMRRHAASFMGIQETSTMLDRMRDLRPDLVKAVVPVLISPAQLTEVLKGLLDEEIPIRDIRLILESIAQRVPASRRSPQDPIDIKVLTDYVRYDLRRVLCAKYAASRERLGFYSVAHDVENAVAGAMQNANGQTVLALSPQDRQQIIMAFSDAINPHLHLNNPAVIVVNQPSVRKPLWNLLKPYLPEAVVLAYQDLTPELSPQAVKVVMME